MLKTRFTLLAIPLLITSYTVIGTSTVSNAPKASVQEAKIKHWRSPDSDLSFTDIAELETGFIDTTPDSLDDDLPMGELGKQGEDVEKILALARDISQGKHGQIDSLLIAQNNTMLFESYFKRGRIDLSHPQSSATKSYTSLALGRAIQMGYLSMADLDKPVASFLSDLDSKKFAKGADTITLHHALTMTTGIRLEEEDLKELRENPSLVKGQKEVQAMFERMSPINADSHVFSYGTGPDLIMQVINSVVPEGAESFIANELLGKLGIDNYGWQVASSGVPESGWKASFTSRDMMKFGLLALNQGRWKGEQLIPKAYIKKSTSKIIRVGDDDIFGGGDDVSNQSYGYLWWSTDLQHGGKRYHTASAQGGGGMFIMLIEELNMVVVVTAHHREHKTQQMIAENIIPAFSS